MTTSQPEREAPSPPSFALRPEVEGDIFFRLALFRASRGPGWDQVPLPPEMVDKLMEQQFRAQTLGYRASFPNAQLEIVTVDSAPVGRLATDRDARGVHLIDIALIPERRGQGIGEAILRGLMAEAAGAGTPVTLQVARDNPGAQRLYFRLGFVLTEVNDTHLSLRWPAPSPSAPAPTA
ncbi:MAG: GNAT family N-acetyltransferase [Caulobacter sp.]|nr:GNAT family N-acetyltransferase [Caulobacter sp.]